MENFSGRTEHALKQDVLVKISTLNLTTILVCVAQWMATRLYQECRRDYQVNFASARSKMKDNVVRLLSLDWPPDLLRRLLSAADGNTKAPHPFLPSRRSRGISSYRIRIRGGTPTSASRKATAVHRIDKAKLRPLRFAAHMP